MSDKATFEPPTGTPDIEKILVSAERNDVHFVLPEDTHG